MASLTSTTRDDAIARLEVAAKADDLEAFVTVCDSIDWGSRSAEDLARGVRSALMAGAHLIARRLAEEGARRYRDSEDLQKLAYLLAPPKVLRTDLPPDKSLRANRDWLKEHAAQYKGRWVALRNGLLIASGAKLKDVASEVGDLRTVFVTRVD
jgi:hypothetical protein